jgi:hypothetical protein
MCPAHRHRLGDPLAFTEHFGGRVWVRFQDGCGSAFKFTLPASRHDEKGGARAMKQLPQVLLVDDNPADVGLARAALAGGRHQSVDIARSYETGRQLLCQQARKSGRLFFGGAID